MRFDPRTGQDQTPASAAPLREACAADLKEAMEADDADRIAALLRAVSDFALIERGVLKPGSRRAQQALRVARLSLAQRLIARHLSKPSLSPAMVADLLGVSVRYLHVLFETTGTSFSQTVTTQRLHESRRLLREKPQRPIADIALACGFGSLATFYRIFSASEGVTPGEYRAAGLQDSIAAEIRLQNSAVAVAGTPPGTSHLTVK
ncbi:helix-turn-helix transcriptional regulator [Bradyrhizobium tropiciagri]|uniref:helix-turn-helix transcriptional regulator n=1 Tax=Bradyrhizobium tropiciagri TaxID=312253 RepID=UPI0032DFA7D0